MPAGVWLWRCHGAYDCALVCGGLGALVSVSGFWSGLCRECRVGFQTLVVAGVAWLLPWPLAFRALRFLTRFSIMCSGLAPQVRVRAPQLSAQPDLVRHFELHRLVDMADHFLTQKYGAAWMRRHLLISGDPLPPADEMPKAIFLNLHYGQGFWALRHFRDRGWPLSLLYRPPPLRPAWGERLESWLGWRRMRQAAVLGGAPGIAANPGCMALMRERLRQASLIAMPDVPPEAGQRTVPLTLFGRPARFPAGVIRLAVESGVPAVIYVMWVDPATGDRHFHIRGPFVGLDEEGLAQVLGEQLENSVRAYPAAWRLLHWSEGYFMEG